MGEIAAGKAALLTTLDEKNKDTVFTLLRRNPRQTSLQSLLDTTPPKRVPVLWDGPAPAPSSGTATHLKEYKVSSIRLAVAAA